MLFFGKGCSLYRSFYMAIEIKATGSYVPEKILTNDDLSKMMDTSDEWIRSHTGISARHIAHDDEATSDLAYRAALSTLKAYNPENPEQAAAELDLVIVATASPDYPGFPSVACMVQNRIGAKRAGAFDIAAGCTGFIYALDIAASMTGIHGRKKALVIGADTLSRITDWTDRNTCVLFGDGAGAAILEETEEPASGKGKRGVIRSVLGADGSGSGYLILRRGGTRDPFRTGETVAKPGHIEMDGHAVYLFAVNAVTSTIRQLLKDEGLSIDQITRIIPHQANERIINAAAKRLGIGMDKFFLNIEKYANTSAASVPIALAELDREGTLKKGDIIMTVGFGAGLTYGGNLIIW
jgi:3-oxoacyl-[acyl-carrier-protein] synthase-3